MNKIKKYTCYLVTILILIATTYIFTVASNANLLTYIFVILIDLLLLYNELFQLETPNKSLIVSISFIYIFNFYIWIQSRDYVFLIFFILSVFQVIRSFKKYIYYLVNVGTLILTNIIIVIDSNSTTDMWKELLITDSLFLMANFFVYLLWIMIIQNEELNINKKKLLQENLKNEYAYEQLKHAYEELENYTVLKERDRIAREMHDTVGHNLTITLVQLENYGIDKVRDEDKLEYSNIVEGVRSALYNIRTTVHKVKETSDWWKEIDKLINNLKEKGILSINYSRDDFSNVSIDKIKCIYNVIQEAITNGVKHGNATAFIIAIKEVKNTIITRVINNGIGSSAYKKGFGLLTMEEKLRKLNGKLEIESSIDEGFTLTAYLPKGDKCD